MKVEVAVDEVREQVAAEVFDACRFLEFRVDSDITLAEAAGALDVVAGAQKRAEEARKSVTRPLDEAKKKLMELFAPMALELTRIDGHLRSEIVGWRRRQQSEADALARAARDRQLQEAMDTGTICETPIPEPVAQVVAAPKMAGATFRPVWKYRILNPEDIPREFLVPDHSALQALAKSQKERAKVAGVEFYVEEIVARTGR